MRCTSKRANPIISAIAVLAACVAPTPAPTPLNYTIEAAPDTVFNAVVSLFNDWGVLISASDRATGVVSTEEVRLSGGLDNFLGQRAGHWVDCGSEYLISRSWSADEIRMRIQVKLDPAQGSQTSLRVLTSMNAYESGKSRLLEGPPLVRCTSRGRLEERLVEDLRARLGRTGA